MCYHTYIVDYLVGVFNIQKRLMWLGEGAIWVFLFVLLSFSDYFSHFLSLSDNFLHGKIEDSYRLLL